MSVDHRCSHLASDGPYRIICEELIQKYPNLQHKDFEHAEAPPRARSTFRLVALDFQSSCSHVGVICVSAEPKGLDWQ